MCEHIPLDPSQWDQTDYPLDTLRGYVGVGGGGGVEYVGVGGGGKLGRGESGTSSREHRSKTAQILLEKPFKNHRKKWAVFGRFFKQDLSGLSSFSKKTAQTAQTAQILLENRSNRSNLERFLSGISTRDSTRLTQVRPKLLFNDRLLKLKE